MAGRRGLGGCVSTLGVVAATVNPAHVIDGYPRVGKKRPRGDEDVSHGAGTQLLFPILFRKSEAMSSATHNARRVGGVVGA